MFGADYVFTTSVSRYNRSCFRSHYIQVALLGPERPCELQGVRLQLHSQFSTRFSISTRPLETTTTSPAMAVVSALNGGRRCRLHPRAEGGCLATRATCLHPRPRRRRNFPLNPGRARRARATRALGRLYALSTACRRASGGKDRRVRSREGPRGQHTKFWILTTNASNLGTI